MSLFYARVELLGTENAFKIGPCIKEVEDAGARRRTAIPGTRLSIREQALARIARAAADRDGFGAFVNEGAHLR